MTRRSQDAEQFREADELAQRYVLLGERLSSVRADDVVGISGAFCLRCGGGPATTRTRGGWKGPGKTEYREVCSTCGEPWTDGSFAHRNIWRSQIASGVRVTRGIDGWHVSQKAKARRGVAEEHLARLVDEWRPVADRIQTAPPRVSSDAWEFAVWCWLAYLQPRIGQVEIVLEFGKRHRPQFGSWWELETVAAGILQAREWARWRINNPRWKEQERTMATSEWITTREAAERLAVTIRQVQRLIECGVLKAMPRGMPGARRETFCVLLASVEAELQRRTAVMTDQVVTTAARASCE